MTPAYRISKELLKYNWQGQLKPHMAYCRVR